ncbi:hypothetical protein M5D96_005606, partial [Drosophila gunungcola]
AKGPTETQHWAKNESLPVQRKKKVFGGIRDRAEVNWNGNCSEGSMSGTLCHGNENEASSKESFASVCAEHYDCVHIRAYFSRSASRFDAAKLS